MSQLKKSKGFSEEEKEAMRERAKEIAEEGRSTRNKVQGESDVLKAIGKMPEPDRTLAKKLHNIIKSNAPVLIPKTWYGMPAYANSNGKVVCFFQNASKFKYRYSTLGFNDAAHLDDGNIWPTAFAIKKLTSVEEEKIISLVRKAVKI